MPELEQVQIHLDKNTKIRDSSLYTLHPCLSIARLNWPPSVYFFFMSFVKTREFKCQVLELRVTCSMLRLVALLKQCPVNMQLT